MTKLANLEQRAGKATRHAITALYGSPADFAEALGMNPRTAERLFSGRQPPPAGLAEQMADQLDQMDDPASAKAATRLRAFVVQRRTPKDNGHV